MQLDPFSDLLQLLDAHSVVAGGLVTGGKWAIAFPESDQIKFWGIVRGGCSFLMHGETQPIAVEAGDIFLLRTPRSHVLASDLTAKVVPLNEILQTRTDAVATHGESDTFFMIGGKVELADNSAQLLIDELPPLIHMRAHSESATPLASGRLRAMGDKRLAPALQLMHGEPGRLWHLGELAKSVAMSRATF